MAGKARGVRRLLLGIVGLLVLLAVVVALAPTLVSKGLGHGAIRDALSKRVNGTVDFNSISLSWTGSQSVDGLVVTDESGREVAKLDMSVQGGLAGFLLGGLPPIEARLTGSLAGDLRENGSTSFGDVLVKDGAPEPDPGTAGGPLQLAGIPRTIVELENVTITMRELATGRDVVLRDLDGRLAYEPGAEATVSLSSATLVDDQVGSIALEIASRGLFDAAGTLAPAGAMASVELTVDSVPLLWTTQRGRLDRLELTISSDDITKVVKLAATARAAIEGHDASVLEGSLEAQRLVRSDGTLDFGLDTLTGSLRGSAVPTALFQPLLANLPVQTERDIGPVADLSADFSSGQTKEVLVTLDGEHLEVRLAGQVDPDDRSVRGERLKVAGRLHPDLLAALTSIVIAAPARVDLDLSSFFVPPRNDADEIELRAFAAEGTLTIDEPVTIEREGERPTSTTIERLTLALATPALEQGVHVEGSASVDGAAVTIDQMVTGLLDESGALAPLAAIPTGVLECRGLRGAVVAGLLDDPSPVVGEVLDDTFDLTMRTTGTKEALEAVVDLQGSRLDLDVMVIRRSDELFVARCDAGLTATPRLVELLQSGSESPVVLAGPARLALQVVPFSLPGSWPNGYEPPDEPVSAQLTSAGAVFEQVTEKAQPIGVASIDSELWLTFHDAHDEENGHEGHDHAAPEGGTGNGRHMAYRARGTGLIIRADAGLTIADLRYDVSIDPDFELLVTNAVIQARELSVGQLELALGRESGAYSDWLGDAGTALLRVQRDGGQLQTGISTALPNLRSNFEASADGEILTLREVDASVTLPRAALQAYLSPAAADGVPPQERLTVQEDLTLQLSAARPVRVPLGMLTGKPFDPASVDVDVALQGGPLRLVNAEGVPTSLDDLQIGITADDLSDGIAFSLVGSAGAPSGRAAPAASAGQATGEPAPAGAAPGSIDMRGTLTNLLDDASRVRVANGTLAANATATQVPTLVLDAIGNLGGLLVATVGPQTDATLQADDFSSRGGSLSTRIQTSNGWLETTVTGGDGAYRIGTDTPLQAELRITSALGQRVLYKINPLLADVRSTKEPIRATVSNVVLPADRDVSRLNADVELAIGEVEFDSGSLMLQLLKLAKSDADRRTLPGYIEPIKAKIRDGIVTYERFDVRIDKFTQRYSGQVDLNTNRVDLRTELPLKSLTASVKELRGYADDLVVPIVTRGVFGNLKTEIDPDFDLVDAAAKSGIQGAIDDLLKDEDVDLGGVFDDLFGGDKKKDGDKKK